MEIKILGTGCPKCIQLTENAKKAAEDVGISYEITKVTDINKIMEFGVMITPALVINGEVKSAGKILNVDEIKKLFNK